MMTTPSSQPHPGDPAGHAHGRRARSRATAAAPAFLPRITFCRGGGTGMEVRWISAPASHPAQRADGERTGLWNSCYAWRELAFAAGLAAVTATAGSELAADMGALGGTRPGSARGGGNGIYRNGFRMIIWLNRASGVGKMTTAHELAAPCERMAGRTRDGRLPAVAAIGHPQRAPVSREPRCPAARAA
jgi:hypothetical protein